MIALNLQQNPCPHPLAALLYASVIAPPGEW
jgi:hypothetical protein